MGIDLSREPSAHGIEGNVEQKQALAYPLLGYHILKNNDQPTLAVIAFQTEAGPSLYAATRDILEELAEAFQRHAANMPRKNDQN